MSSTMPLAGHMQVTPPPPPTLPPVPGADVWLGAEWLQAGFCRSSHNNVPVVMMP